VRRTVHLALLVSVLLAFGGTTPAFARARGASSKAIATSAFLKAGDFPAGAGFVEGKPSASTPPSGSSCGPINRVLAKYKKYRFRSPRFATSNASAADTVYVFPNVKAAKLYLTAFKRADAKTCLLQDTKRAVGSNTTVQLTDIGTSGIGDDGVGFALQVASPNDQGGFDVLAVDAPGYRVGRVFVGFTFQSVDEPLDIQQQLVQASIGRLTRALTRA
jgi:hypothetical protein